jgi:uncharacterized protein YjiS (DUF1127 family)
VRTVESLCPQGHNNLQRSSKMSFINDRTLLVAASYVGSESGTSRDTVTVTPTPPLDQRGRLANAVLRTAARVAGWVGDHRRASRRIRELRELDTRTLRDLGLTRSELASVVAEVDGNAEATRRRIEASVIAAASSGLRVRNVEAYMSLAVLIGFGAVLLVAGLSTPPLFV